MFRHRAHHAADGPRGLGVLPARAPPTARPAADAPAVTAGPRVSARSAVRTPRRSRRPRPSAPPDGARARGRRTEAPGG
ncbi:hypothetical protein C1708_05010 [Streptomyces sp. DH-12]|nr:hypothetical protein C1708_05010 [Streptomyces sp. DH-12]